MFLLVSEAYQPLHEFPMTATVLPSCTRLVSGRIDSATHTWGATAGRVAEKGQTPFERENGKFQAVGNGGWAGVISYPHMALALSRGYATASTDSGHDTPGAGLALAPGEAERVCLSPEPL